jgi:hypothetical protein
MPLQATSGAASYDAFGGGAPAGGPANYIEDVFSTYLYTGTGSSQTITNNIDLSTKGGLVWIKSRSAATGHRLTDTARGVTKSLESNSTAAEATESTGLTAFGTTGFTIGADADYNTSADTYASWSFREQEKFFDVVTYTGDGTNNRAISHNLGSTPGFIIVKRTNSPLSWFCYHTSLGVGNYIALNQTAASVTNADAFPAVSSTTFTPVNDANQVGLNTSGDTYVAYLFAHNAGGFGLTGTDNVISCGSFTSSALGVATVNLGYEPQWIIFKGSNGVTNWQMVDNMRGFVVGAANSGTSFLNANTSAVEGTSPPVGITNTGFNFDGAANITYIYIAIRRGPMKVPTVGTSVYQAVTRTGNSPTVNSITSVGFPPDSIWQKRVSGSAAASNVFDRLRGRYFLSPRFTDAETAANTSATRDLISFDMAGFSVGEQFSSELNANTRPEVYWNFGRAPNFFDEVCYTGTGSATTVTHNLTVVPEMMIVKRRSGGGEWTVYHSAMGNTKRIFFDTAAEATGTMWNNTTPTSSVFSVGTDYQVNLSASTYVTYLFATCAGVSKVGSYTGTGALLTVNCGFTSSARFILIKRTDSTGDWYVYDSARGISSSDDPYLLLNSTAVEVTGTNYVDTDSTGFKVTAAAPAGLNASGGTYIFLAIA